MRKQKLFFFKEKSGRGNEKEKLKSVIFIYFKFSCMV